jgi:hypothetical protein
VLEHWRAWIAGTLDGLENGVHDVLPESVFAADDVVE